MAFLDDLLTGSRPTLETRSLSTIDPTQRTALNNLIAQLSGRPAANPNDMVAQLTQPERTSLAALEERSRALAVPDTTTQAARGSVEQLLDFEGQTANANDYFMANVQNPALESFGRDVLPAISRQFGGADFFSSERQTAESTAREDLLNALTASRTSVNLDQFNKSRDRALQAAGLAPNLAQADAIRTGEQTQILEALGLPRNIEQAGLDKANAEDARVQNLLAQLGLTPTIENIGMTNPGSAGLLNIILGGAAGGIGDILGEAGGSYLEDLLGGLLGLGGGSGNPNEGPSDADQNPPEQDPAPGQNTGTTVTPSVPLPVPGQTTPAGTVTVTEGANNQPVATQPQAGIPGGINLGGAGLAGALAGSAGLGLLGAPAGATFITEGLGGALASQLGGAAAAGGAGAAAGAGAVGAAGTGAATATGAGAAAAGGIFQALGGIAIPLSIFAMVASESGVDKAVAAAKDQWGRTASEILLSEYYRQLNLGTLHQQRVNPLQRENGRGPTRLR